MAPQARRTACWSYRICCGVGQMAAYGGMGRQETWEVRRIVALTLGRWSGSVERHVVVLLVLLRRRALLMLWRGPAIKYAM